MAKIKPNSIEEAIAAFDRGDEVQTVEMGGLGAAYEMAIQCAVFEILRGIEADADLKRKITETPKDKQFPLGVSDKIDALTLAADAKDPETGEYKLGGLSGAQAGAAQSLAISLVTRGFDAVRAEAPERLIFVRKQNPMALYASEAAHGRDIG